MRMRIKVSVVGMVLWMGCGGENAPVSDAGVDTRVDTAIGNDVSVTDSSLDSTAADANDGGSANAPRVVALSSSGHDRFFGVTLDESGNAFAVGQFAESIAASADSSIVVAKFNAQGALDTSFGNAGVAIVNVTVGGQSRERARGVVVQSSGRIVVVGEAEHDPTAAGVLAQDTDIVLIGLTAAGARDNTFGTNGIVRFDAGTAAVVTNNGAMALSGADQHYSAALAANDTIVVHGGSKAESRNDSDLLLARFTANGVLDTTFSSDGKVTLDVGNVSESPRGITVLANGSILASGYATHTTSTALGEATQQPILYKVNADGSFDTTFATSDATTTPGVWHDFAVPSPARAEAYSAQFQGTNIVTFGYGPTQIQGATGTDLIALRFTGAGVLDTTFGTQGASVLDVAMLAETGRNMIVLPDQRILGVGSARAAGSTTTDLVAVVLGVNGAPDTTFASRGFRLYDVGANDVLWGLAQRNGRIVGVGIAGGVAAPVVDAGVDGSVPDAGPPAANADDDAVFFSITL